MRSANGMAKNKIREDIERKIEARACADREALAKRMERAEFVNRCILALTCPECGSDLKRGGGLIFSCRYRCTWGHCGARPQYTDLREMR